MAQSIKEESFLTPEDVADILRLDGKEVHLLLEQGTLPGFKLGQTWRIRERDLMRAIEAAQIAGQPVAASAGGSPRSRRSPAGKEIHFHLLGMEREAASWADMLHQVLNELSSRDKSFIIRFGQLRGRSRRYAAFDRDDLYAGRADLSRRFSKRLNNGWWVGTNYSREEIRTILGKACEVAGLRLGVDLRLSHARRKVDTRKAMTFVGIARDPRSDVSRRHDEYFVQAVEPSESRHDPR